MDWQSPAFEALRQRGIQVSVFTQITERKHLVIPGWNSSNLKLATRTVSGRIVPGRIISIDWGKDHHCTAKNILQFVDYSSGQYPCMCVDQNVEEGLVGVVDEKHSIQDIFTVVSNFFHVTVLRKIRYAHGRIRNKRQ